MAKLNEDAEKAQQPEEQIVNHFLPDLGWETVEIKEEEWLRADEPIEAAKMSLYIGEAPIAMIGGLTIYKGHPGNGKSMAMSISIASILKGEGIGPIKRGTFIESPTILYVDTEMEKYNTQRLMNRVYSMLGWSFGVVHEEFKILRLRDTIDVEDVLKKIWKAVSIVRPTFCFIDGLLDCVKNFNDNEESSELIRTLGAGASHYNMSVMAVIHKNPGSDKSTGHAGSFSDRKAFCTLDISKDDNLVFHIKQSKARDRDAEEVMFRVTDDKDHIGIPEIIDQLPKKEKFTIEECEQYLRGIADKIQWPASIGEIKASIKDTYGITNNGEQTEITEKAKNRNWLVAQDKSEWTSGQKAAKWKLQMQDLPF